MVVTQQYLECRFEKTRLEPKKNETRTQWVTGMSALGGSLMRLFDRIHRMSNSNLQNR
jgi:hypothetical protein